MMVVALTAVVFWKLKHLVPWRWFWAGAGIWTVGVALKFAAAFLLNPIFTASLTHYRVLNLAIGSVYLGLMTGVFEIGVTLAAGLKWQKLTADANRAVALGLGAGAFEALALGLGAFAGTLAAILAGQDEMVLRELAGIAEHTPLLWLAGPVERITAILVHTASRVLVLRAIRSRRWAGFWAGFAWLSLVDLVAGVGILTGLVATHSQWWMELAISPFAIVSIPLLRRSVAGWPNPLAPPAPDISDFKAQARNQGTQP